MTELLDSLLKFDLSLFRSINLDGSNSVFDLVLPIMRNKLVWIPLYLLFIFLIFKKYKKKGIYILLLAFSCAGFANTLSSEIIKKSVERPRPCHTYTEAKDINVLVRCGRGDSFTSSHATNHFAIALFFGLIWSSWFWWLCAWAFIIGYAQIYVGVHYPIDILVGSLLGIFIGLIFGNIAKHIIKKYIYIPNQNTA